jgi:hypothetical protein
MANTIYGDKYTDPGLYDLAVTIGRWQIVLLEVRRLKQQLVPTDQAWAPLDRYERRALSHRNRVSKQSQLLPLFLIVRQKAGRNNLEDANIYALLRRTLWRRGESR